MTHAPMKPFYALIKNSTGRIVSYEFEKPQATSGWQDSVTDGTHRIERIGGEQAAERKTMAEWMDSIPSDILRKVSLHDLKRMWDLTKPKEPAQDSELVRELKALRDDLREDWSEAKDKIADRIAAILSKHAKAEV